MDVEDGTTGGLVDGATGGLEDGATGGLLGGATGGLVDGATGGLEDGVTWGLEDEATGGLEDGVTLAFAEIPVFDFGFVIKDSQALLATLLDFLPIISSSLLKLYFIWAGIKLSTQCFLELTTFKNRILICSLYKDGLLIKSN